MRAVDRAELGKRRHAIGRWAVGRGFPDDSGSQSEIGHWVTFLAAQESNAADLIEPFNRLVVREMECPVHGEHAVVENSNHFVMESQLLSECGFY
jgi:hypothetical protein